MARYHRYSSGAVSNEIEKEDAITKKRVEQLKSEIKIKKPDEQDYYAKKALKKARRHKYR